MFEHDKNLYAVGNRIITIIDKKICLVNPITFNVFNLCIFDENNIIDIATYNNYIFIKSNHDKIYKIPKFILQIGNFDIKEYCYYDFETTSIEDLWEI